MWFSQEWKKMQIKWYYLNKNRGKDIIKMIFTFMWSPVIHYPVFNDHFLRCKTNLASALSYV